MLSESQRAAYAERLRRGRSQATGGIGRRPAGLERTALSFGQEQLWFIDRFAPGLPTYNIPQALRLTGSLDVPALGRAFDALADRHEALRTRFVAGPDGRPGQVVDPSAGVALPLVDLSGAEQAERDARLADLAAQEAVRPFELAEGPLLRLHLVRLDAEEHVLLLVVHHVVFDAWSLGVLVRDLLAFYQAEVSGTAAALEPMPIQFADYALWERERLQDAVLDDLVDYWRSTMDGFETLQFPTDRPRPLVDGFAGKVAWRNLGPQVWDGVRDLARREGVTPFVVVMAALQTLLHRYTGQDDIVVGTASANRGRAELAPLIGFLVNTLPIRTDLSGDPTVAELLAKVRETTVAAYAHQDLPFARLVEAVGVERDTSRAPVFQVAMTFAEAPEDLKAAELTVRQEKIDLPVAKFDLDFFAQVRSGELWIELSYSTTLFDDATVDRLLGNLGVLLAGLVQDASRRVSRLPVLTEAEWRREVVEWNETAVDLPVVCIHQGFEAQVVRSPDAVAVELGSDTVTYAELNAWANRVARCLRGLGVGPEVLVGVSMGPSPRRLAVLLGILKAGGGYVPLDPALPADRLAFMMRDTAMPVVVADRAGAAALGSVSARVVSVDDQWPEISVLDSDDPGYPVVPSNVAYVIYTSGSTGRPKGVVVEHRHAVNFLLGMVPLWGIVPGDRVLQFASLNFDVSVMDMFMPLLAGARVVLAAAEVLLSPPRLADVMRGRGVSFACLPPAVVSLLTGQVFPDLRVLLSAGEELSAELVRRWLRPGLRFYNGYGPTEAAIGSTFMEIDGSVFPPPIGRPKPNYQAYVLDAFLNPVPVGVVGELHVGGAGVTRGYLNAPELTEKRFIADPFRDVPGARLYKTGDLVRRNPDGTLVFVGRIDGQVKIRGLRVELGEVETALVAHPGVAQGVVVVAEDRAGEKQLVGYFRSDPQSAGVTTADLRQHLAGRLPVYMVPTHLIAVEDIPLTSNGKVDRTALPSLESVQDENAREVEFVAPRTLIETALTDAFAGLLGRERVGVDEGFFDLGGNSLQAMQLVNRLRTDLAVDVDVAAIFLAPSPRQLTIVLRDKHGLEDMDLSEGGLEGLSDEETAELLSAME
jgi:amino acid adenylation domain-containing protein